MDLIDTPDTAALIDMPEISLEEFEEGFGETLQRTLDVNTWSTGEDLGEVYTRIQREVQEAVGKENEYRAVLQRDLFPRLAELPGAPKGAGVFPIYPDLIPRIHSGLLFNGGVEAADGTQQTHDTLPLTIFQIGVSLVSYQGSQGTWSQRLFRRDLRVVSRDPIEEVYELLERREQRSALNQDSRRDTLSELARRGIMAHAERAILLERSNAAWRMGHGNIAPYELITGSGNLDLMVEGTKVLRRMIEDHQKFVYVASEPADRVLLTIGDALRPLEYAVVHTLRDSIYRIVERGHYRMKVSVDMTWDGVPVARPEEWIKRFRDEIAPQVVVGVYRASRLAPPQVFYAHQDHADMAAHIAVADSVLQVHRGFPQLIDLADYVCRGVFGADTLRGPVSSAYIDAGAPYRFLSERQTRYQ